MHDLRAGDRREGEARPARRVWTEQSLLAELARQRGAEEAAVAERILTWAHERGLTVRLEAGATTASFQGGLDEAQVRIFPFYVYSSGEVEIQFGQMVSVPYRPFDELERRRELARKGLARRVDKVRSRARRPCTRGPFGLVARGHSRTAGGRGMR